MYSTFLLYPTKILLEVRLFSAKHFQPHKLQLVLYVVTRIFSRVFKPSAKIISTFLTNLSSVFFSPGCHLEISVVHSVSIL